MQSSALDIDALKKLSQGWQAVGLPASSFESMFAQPLPAPDAYGIAKVGPEPQKNSDSPSAAELATLEHEGLGRDC